MSLKVDNHSNKALWTAGICAASLITTIVVEALAAHFGCSGHLSKAKEFAEWGALPGGVALISGLATGLLLNKKGEESEKIQVVPKPRKAARSIEAWEIEKRVADISFD